MPSPADKPPARSHDRPWRAEGLPPGAAPKPEPPKGPSWWIILARAGAIYFAIFMLLQLQEYVSGPPTIPYTEFRTQVIASNVKELFVQGYSIQGKLRAERELPESDGQKYLEFTTERPVFAEDDLLTTLEESNAVVRATPVVQGRGTFANLLISLAPIALLIGFYAYMFRRQQQAMGGLFGGRQRKPVDPENVRVNFDDVAGIDEVEQEIQEVVDYLKNTEKYRAIGARVPKGVLLSGPPGTGKTLLARATAGEAGVPFFSASASEFIEMVVGMGASRVRELFKSAREVAPSIIFIDEIDTIGRSRGGARAIGGHDEREQTLNQILTEMDGFSAAEGVIVLAATNRPDVLDPALLRPGRFDRQITVHPPDKVGRRAILDVHARKIAMTPSLDLDQIARMTPGMTGAELANLVNEAAITAVRHGQREVRFQDFTEALEKIRLGAARNVVMPPQERKRTAYHEAGHALLGMLQRGADPVRKVSIIPRGRALGVTLSTPESDRYGYDEAYLRGRIIGALGGMAAEEVVFGVITTGAENDLQQVTGIARAMVGKWGMSEKIGPVSVYPVEGDPRMAGVSEATLDAVDAEVRSLIEDCYQSAKKILEENRSRLDRIVEQLLARETLDEDDVYAAAGISREQSEEDSPPFQPEAH